MTTSKNILVVTPMHKPTESLLGYVLRVSERNGYDTPWHIMTHAGLDQGNMDTVGFPVQNLAAILGRDSTELEPLSYQGIDQDGKREFRILGQRLGGTLRAAPMSLNKPQLCVHCVHEHGYLDAFFDLSIAVACPEHGKTLVSSCPECGNALRWFRPGILTCRCGADLTHAPTTQVSEEVKELLSIIKAKVHGKSLHTINSTCAFPIHELEIVSLLSLLIAIDKLGRHSLSRLGQDNCDSMSILQATSKLLQNWPENYRSFLRELYTPSRAGNSLCKHYEELFSSLFSRHKRFECPDFLLKEFVRFAMEEWDDGVVNWQLIRGETKNRRFVSCSEQAVRLGVDQRMLKQLGKLGLIAMKTVGSGSRKRYIIDTKAIPQIKDFGGNTFGERQAAAYIELPVRVLKSLRTSGHYEIRHVARPLKAYHESDLLSLKRRLTSLGDGLNIAHEGSITLRKVMRLMFKSSSGKADFIRAILALQVKAIGYTGEGISGLQFAIDQVKDFLRDKRAEVGNDTWSLAEAAKFLHCDPMALPALIDLGLIDSINAPASRRVTIKSVECFHSKFVSVVRLAKEIGTSSMKLQALYTKQNIPMKVISRGDGRVGQAFILREIVPHIDERHFYSRRSTTRTPSDSATLDRTSNDGLHLARSS